jgi:hypothetical protein
MAALLGAFSYPMPGWPGVVSSPLSRIFQPISHSAEAQFAADGEGYRLVLRHGGGASIAFPVASAGRWETIRVEFAGGRQNISGFGDLPEQSVIRAYSGQSYAPAHGYSKIRFPGIYPGIDLVWRADRGQPEFEFTLAPGADPRSIRLHFPGSPRVAISPGGDLVVESSFGRASFRRPVAWEDDDGPSRPLPVRYRIAGSEVSFAVSGHDPGRRLTIDPVVTLLSYFGGGLSDVIYAMATDGSGAIYVAGETWSADFPGAASTPRGKLKAFVSKLSADGKRLIYTTILSGSVSDSARALAVTPGGDAYVAGVTDGGFPVTNGSLRTSAAGMRDVFAAHLNTSGGLVYSTYLGGAGMDYATGIAVDTLGNAYVAGHTASLQFPVTAGAAQTGYSGGAYDGFVAKLNPAGSALVYSSLIGGSGIDLINGIAVNSAGEACFTGATNSTNLPVQNAYQRAANRETDALVGCLNAAGSQFKFLTYYGGSASDSANAVALDTAGDVYVTGSTVSPDFPSTFGIKKAESDAFVLKFTATGVRMFAAVFGGSGSDSGMTISVDSQGRATVGGNTNSPDFPTLDAAQSAFAGGGFDGFVTRLATDGGSILDSTYVGGAGDDRIVAVTTGVLSILAAGTTISPDLRTTSDAFEPADPGPASGFFIRLGAQLAMQLLPASGSGSDAVFQASLTDANGGSAGISKAVLLINGSFTGVSACEIAFVPPNRFELLNDTGTAWSSALAAGTGGALQNSQCTLQLAGASVVSGDDGTTFSLPVHFASSFAGNKTAYGMIVDRSGKSAPFQPVGTWSVPGSANLPPSPPVVSPSSGSGLTQTFAWTLSDPNGYQDLKSAIFLIAGSFNGQNACEIYYAAPANAVYLLNDAGSAWLGPSTIGSGPVLQNAQCSIIPATASKTSSGNSTTLSIAVSFATSFSGSKNSYGITVDSLGTNSGWTSSGTWIVPGTANAPPSISGMSPAEASGASQTFTFSATDPNGAPDITTMLLLINGSLNGVQACEIYYNVLGNAVYLLNDTGTAWLGPSAIGTGPQLQNTQCTISPGSGSRSSNGNSISLTIPVTSKAGFSGARNVYVLAADRAGLNSGWNAAGTWWIP